MRGVGSQSRGNIYTVGGTRWEISACGYWNARCCRRLVLYINRKSV